MMLARHVLKTDCQFIANLERELFDSHLEVKELQSMMLKPAFYGAVVSTLDKPEIINAYILAYFTKGAVEIISIGTVKSQQRRGYGRFILQHLISLAKQRAVNRIVLEVACDNLPAIILYDSCGFGDCGQRRNYYQRPNGTADALIMTLLLDSPFS